MKARKIIAIVFTCALVLSLGGCRQNQQQSQTESLPGGTPGTAGAGTELTSLPEDTLREEEEISSGVALDNRWGATEFRDDNVTIDLSLDKEHYTINDLIRLHVKITNHATGTIAFQKGSGSNRIPDGLQVTLGGLTPMYQPTVATMDMQYDRIAPGESLELELPFAPYLPTGEGVMGPGLDQTLDWFTDNEEYHPAPMGAADGTLVFTYQLLEEGAGEGPLQELMEGGNPHVIQGSFSTNIVE